MKFESTQVSGGISRENKEKSTSDIKFESIGLMDPVTVSLVFRLHWFQMDFRFPDFQLLTFSSSLVY